MIIEQLKIQTKDKKNLQLYAAVPADCAYLVVLVHGIGDHAMRFKALIESFTEATIGVVTFDLRGHGLSEGKRGFAKRYESFYFDLDAVLEYCYQRYPQKERILYGHSFGASLIVNYASTQLLKISGLVIASPWFKLYQQPSFLKLLAARFLKLIPVAAARTGIDPACLSRDVTVLKEYTSDPLVHDKLTNKLFLHIVAQAIIASRSIYKLNYPLLVMHGTEDTCTSHKESIEFTRNANESTTTLKLWDGYYHELHNDIGREAVFEYLLAWINKLGVPHETSNKG